ncbi:flagellar hook-length control protein FliK [Anaerovibrio lipolyticus]|uniref:flagellar hook-length control protein FliK n=1 Tax=Anaerovibrio lipolyticus TaxID=82374 RepID=UPI001F1DE84B|nr:flagellar hook-length control protein FliK [Anaerovibrio lipolyticus]MCF2600369.1 flagellar hook-length control protein FliK [Anaerovibrio lipolyticus]
MSNNVNVFSLNAGSSKEAVKVNSKASTRTAKTKQENFSQTLDQAQQASNKNDVSKDADYTKTDSNAQGKAVDTADTQSKAQETSEASQPQGEKPQTKAQDKAKGEVEAQINQQTQGTQQNPQAAALLAAEAQASLVQDIPMAELNTYFKGDTRLQTVQENVQGQLAGDEALAEILQQTNQQENPVESLQPVQMVEQVQKVETVAVTAEQPVKAQESYTPNDIAALLGSKPAQNKDNTGNVVVQQSQQVKNQQMLNLLAGQQGAYTPQPAVQQVQEVQEDGVSMTQLANLTDGLEFVESEGQLQQNMPVMNGQQSMTNGQGQQQGSQLQGEASFDVVVPSQQDGKNVENDSVANQGLSFQQNLDNQIGANQKVEGNAAQTNQARETYNVPQQIVEQAKLLQRGTDSQMIIKLNPEHLGQLSLKVSVNGNGGVTATFHTDNAQVRAILETTMTQLRQQLDEQGIKVDNVEVHTGLPDGQLPQDQGQQGFYQDQGQQVRSRQTDLQDFEESSENLAAELENSQENQDVVLDSQGNQISRGVDYSV